MMTQVFIDRMSASDVIIRLERTAFDLLPQPERKVWPSDPLGPGWSKTLVTAHVYKCYGSKPVSVLFFTEEPPHNQS